MSMKAESCLFQRGEKDVVMVLLTCYERVKRVYSVIAAVRVIWYCASQLSEGQADRILISSSSPFHRLFRHLEAAYCIFLHFVLLFWFRFANSLHFDATLSLRYQITFSFLRHISIDSFLHIISHIILNIIITLSFLHYFHSHYATFLH